MGVMKNYARVLIDLRRTAEGEMTGCARSRDRTGAAEMDHRRVAVARVRARGGRCRRRAAPLRSRLAERELRASPMPAERAPMGMIRAELAVAEGQLDGARTRLDEVLKAEGYPARLSPLVHAPLERAARLALQAGDREKAIEFARDAVRACDRHLGTDHPSAHTGRAQLTLGLSLLASGRTDDARTAFERAATLTAAAGGQDHPIAQDARARLAALTPLSTSR